MAALLTTMAYRLLTSRWPPIFFQPMRNSGTFISAEDAPTVRAGNQWCKIWARPVTPPMANWLGATNQSKDRA